MKKLFLVMFLMAFVSFATMESFTDPSPPGVEISINHELPNGIDVNFESQEASEWQNLQETEFSVGDRITVNDCDLNKWPNGNRLSVNENEVLSLFPKSKGE